MFFIDIILFKDVIMVEFVKYSRPIDISRPGPSLFLLDI